MVNKPEKLKVMIKIFGIIMAIGGAISLVMGIMGIFGSMSLWVSPWALSILGFIFFISGISLLKYRKDTDVVQAENRN
ncbi:hypothetical protein Y10_01590 [Neptunitalea sp. Y10]|uniref:Uncharacterized protein n=2 Tax=Neptunitalea lumnitzerae TaxID=2965509 RepID=A0ABQ5MEH4_9FLAO|nr:hypothetical protein Y10_01590 [Neptunitalea sp. Y10]